MNPLTLVKRIQNINSKEAQLGISEDASWHAKYKDSAYVYAGSLPFDLTEGDLLAIFAQYGEVVDVNLVRDKATGKSKGFAFVAYEDQRSTVLAVDNLNGAQVVGRTIRVDHVTKYKKKAEEDEEEEQRKREERGVCRAFQRGDCTRGATCKFSHNEQRAANTGWGEQDSKWGRDKYDGPKKGGNGSSGIPSNRVAEGKGRGDSDAREERSWGRRRDDDEKLKVGVKNCELLPPRRCDEDNELRPSSREDYGRREEQRSRRHNDGDDHRREEKRPRRRGDDDELEPKVKSRDGEDRDRREDDRPRRRSDDGEFVPKSRDERDGKEDDSRENKRLRKRSDDDEFDPKSVDDRDRRNEKRSRRQNDDEFEQKSRAGQDKREGERLRRHGDDEVQPRSREFRNRTEKRY